MGQFQAIPRFEKAPVSKVSLFYDLFYDLNLICRLSKGSKYLKVSFTIDTDCVQWKKLFVFDPDISSCTLVAVIATS